MEVNRELPNLADGLDESVHVIGPDGRVLVLAYHSLEDRMVKETFARWAGEDRDVDGAAQVPRRTAQTQSARSRAHPATVAPARRRSGRESACRERPSARGRTARLDVPDIVA